MTEVDLWLCWECCIPHLNIGPPRQCSNCSEGLEYLGELSYQDKELAEDLDE
jgi:rubrerythrin